VSAISFNQDNSDKVGQSTTPGADTFQDVHILLTGLPADRTINLVDVWPYGYGHDQYAAPGLPANFPGLDSTLWRAALIQVPGSTTADLYVPSDRGDSNNHYDIAITFDDDTHGYATSYGISDDPTLKVLTPAAVSLGQDNHDCVGKSNTTVGDTIQDVHIQLRGLRSDLGISLVDVWPYNNGHCQYAAPGLPADFPGLNSGVWRAALVRSPGSTTADLYVPSNAVETNNHYDITVVYSDGTQVHPTAWGVSDDPTLHVGSAPSSIMALSLNQDNSDAVSNRGGLVADTNQDVHIVLSGLPANRTVSLVHVAPYGYGEYEFAVPGLPADFPLLKPSAWPAALIRSSSTTADLYVPSVCSETNNHYDLVVVLDDRTQIPVEVWGISDDPTLKVLTPAAVSLGQDNHDSVGQSTTTAGDGFQDVHVQLHGLRSDLGVSLVDVWPSGYGHYQYAMSGLPADFPLLNAGVWRAALVRSPGSTTADVYVPSFSAETNNHYDITVVYSDRTQVHLTAWGVSDDPSLRMTSIGIDAGDGDAGSFAADGYFSGGSTYSTTSVVDTTGVVNPAPQQVYQTERYDGIGFSYTVPHLVPGAPYTVRLHFDEIFFGAPNGGSGGAGSRKFDVTINGTKVLTDFDIFATAGGANKAVVEEFNAVADANRQITIRFDNKTGGAKVNGIEVVAVDPTQIRSVDLSGYFNQNGISADNNASISNIDGCGYSYPTGELGTTISWNGSTFTIGGPGRNDVVKATGQTIALPPGMYRALCFLGTGVTGAQQVTFTINYVDGTHVTVNQTLSDWFAETANVAGESLAKTVRYVNSPSGPASLGSFNLYGYTLSLDPTRTIASITLPDDSKVKLLALNLLP
jgi:hypothetical protein